MVSAVSAAHLAGQSGPGLQADISLEEAADSEVLAAVRTRTQDGSRARAGA